MIGRAMIGPGLIVGPVQQSIDFAPVMRDKFFVILLRGVTGYGYK